jgi:hypothetical protein
MRLLSRRRGTNRRILGISTAALALNAIVFGVHPASASASTIYVTTFYDAQTGLYLDSNYSNPAYPSVGAVYTDPGNGGNYQNWIVEQNGPIAKIVDAQTGLCLDSNYSNPAYPSVGAVYTDPCNGGNYQNWYINYPAFIGNINIIDAQTGLWLDSNYSNPAYPSVGAVYTDPGNGGNYQNWR